MSTLSVYAKGLPEGATEARYLEKIRVIGVDPFILFSGGNGTDITRASWPPVDSSDIVSYLVLQTSFITTKQFKLQVPCDLVVCTFPDGMKNPSMHVERIVPDVTLWTSCLEKALHFF